MAVSARNGYTHITLPNLLRSRVPFKAPLMTQLSNIPRGPISWLPGLIALTLIPLFTGNAAQPPVADKPKATSPDHVAGMKAGLEIFKRDVRQILLARCTKCHAGPRTEGGLDLSSRSSLLRGGESGPAIVVGDHAKSRLYRLVIRKDEGKMPQEGAALSQRHQQALAKWIDLGAPYDTPLHGTSATAANWTERQIDAIHRQYWAFQPLPQAPLSGQPVGKARHPIDRFIDAKLSQEGLLANGPASRAQLIRRAYLDLTGMPPTPQEIRAFAEDKSRDAYEKIIDHLLQSPQYGERWARHWLDVARFAESHGFEHDYDRPHAYHYRDFVIRALNEDLPYNDFVRWQLAGDELAPQNPLALMATGFLGAGVFPTQITANEVERTRYDALDDMLSTTGTAMLGLTIGCARCHDHKFDPIPQADYYRLLSTFTTTVRSNIDLDLDPKETQRSKRVFDQQHKPYVDRLAAFEKTMLPRLFQAWEEAGGKLDDSAAWLLLAPTEIRSSGGATLTAQADGSLLATGVNPDFDKYTFIAETKLEKITGFRLEALAHPSMVKGGPGRAVNGNFDLTNITLDVQPLATESKATRVRLLHPRATFEQPNLFIRYAIDNNPKSGWAVDPQFGKDHAASFEFAEPVGNPSGIRLTFTLSFNGNNRHNIGRLRLALTRSQPPLQLTGSTVPANVLALLKKDASERSVDQQKQLLQWYRTREPQWQRLQQQLLSHLAKAPKGNLSKVLVCTEGAKPLRHHTQGADFFPQTFFLDRGDTDQKRGAAPQGFLQVLDRSPAGDARWERKPPAGSPLSYRRTALANWITDCEHGAGDLLARVIVNRLWQHHFENGLVSTPNDFGKQGTPPSHPLLLDRLAKELIANQWRLKPVHKLIMTSAAYRRNSTTLPKNAARDPDNHFLWRYPVKRLEAEAIRDSMLKVSSLLDPTMFGPGTLDPAHKRRSIYFMVKRSKLIPIMQLFDSPEPLTSVGSRPTTTIAPQALLFLNNPQVRTYSTGFSTRLAPIAKESLVLAVTEGYWLALGRPPTSDERADSVEFINQQSRLYQGKDAAAARSAALADFCQVLFSLNEFIYVR